MALALRVGHNSGRRMNAKFDDVRERAIKLEAREYKR